MSIKIVIFIWLGIYFSFWTANGQPAASHSVTTRTYTYQAMPDDTLQLEVDLPDGPGPFPYLIYVHGGGWQSGNRDVFKKHAVSLASKGIAGVRVSYPLLPDGGTYRSASAAIAGAIRFIQTKAAEWKLDNACFGLCGASAGAHLAALTAMQTPGCRLFVGMAGTYDLFRTKPGNFPVESLRNAYLESSDPETIRHASAIFRIPDRNIPACLLMHGTADAVIDPDQSRIFADSIRAKGGMAKVILYEGVDHGVNSRTDTVLFRTTMQDIFRFCTERFACKRIACVGNSITYGVFMEHPADTYPGRLQEKLGPAFEVRNFGVPGASVQFTKDKTYLKTDVFADLERFRPEILILKLGTNDARPDQWSTDAFFYADYIRLVREMKRIGTTVYLCDPIPPFGEKWKERDRVLTKHLIPLIRRVAREEKLPVVDLYHAYKREPDYYFPDGIHPTGKGYERIAASLYRVIQPLK